MIGSVDAAAREQPDRAAWIVGSEIVSYSELAAIVGRAAGVLERTGVRTGDRVAMVGQSTRSALAFFYAAVARGVVPVLLHPRWTASECAAAVAAAGARRLPDSAFTEAHAPVLKEAIEVDSEAPLAILFTSGTTGAPRGVVLSRRAFEASAAASAENLGWRPNDRWLLSLPVAHVGGLSIVTRCLLARATVVLPPELEQTGRLDADALMASVERDRVTLLSVVPTQLARMLELGPSWNPPASLRAILLGGAAAPRALLERASDRGWPVLTTYGLTEACSQVTTQRYGTVNRGELGSGVPVLGTEVKIVDGRIRVRGPTLLSGVVPPAPVLDSEGWLETGDHGWFDDDGNLHVLGRGRDLIVTGGENVHPLEVERCIASCPGVRDACAFGVPDPVWGERVAVALVISPAFDAAALSGHLGRELAPFKRPRLWTVLPELAVTRGGKLDRAVVARQAMPHLVPLA